MPRGDRENLASTDEDQRYLPSPANIEFFNLINITMFLYEIKKNNEEMYCYLIFWLEATQT